MDTFFVHGRSRVSANLTYSGDEIHVKFGFHDGIKDELKVMADRPRWNPDLKLWTVANTPRSKFALDYLQGKNPYAKYDIPLLDVTVSREACYNHQRQIVKFGLTRKQCIIAAEMGTGKTLASIELLEKSGVKYWWYVAPKAALISVKLDYEKWGATVSPRFMTYEEMIKVVSGWDSKNPLPGGVIFDESSRLKTPEAKRSKAALHLANAIREQDGYVILMSGSPAPKSPIDWWMQCEIACPGFLREGHPAKFRDRLALVKKEEAKGGITFPKIVTFFDSEQKCAVCGKLKDHDVHEVSHFTMLTATKPEDNHKFVASENEVKKLYSRMDGLVHVIMKDDCLDLPEKVYRIIDLEPSKYVKNLAKMIVKTARSAAQALIQLRELSDGFQYHEKQTGTETCTYCNGTKVYKDEPCIHCSAKGFIKLYATETVEIETPKVQALKDIIEEKEEDGRLITYAGFSGSLDRVCNIYSEMKWDWICVDGRGWRSTFDKDPTTMLKAFQDRSGMDRLAFIGHPKSAGMGLTLTASDTTVYYSNDFDNESRIQSENRNHRPGSRGCNIIDLCHLPVDRQVLENLKVKRAMELMTLGELDVYS